MTVFNLYTLYCPVEVKSKEGLLMIRSNVHEHDKGQGQDLVVPNISCNCLPVTGIRFYNVTLPVTIRNLPRPRFIKLFIILFCPGS